MPSLRLLAPALLAAFLAACGGGSSSDDAPNPASIIHTTSTAASQAVCGHQVGPNAITGVVSFVHDGDTLAIGPYTIRLASIDAPELSQPYGADSRAALAAKVLNQRVTVAYASADRYGRAVGNVFSNADAASCDLVNLQQVREGAAWYYDAYQCEVSASDRGAYAEAQESAQAARLGLWAVDDVTPPWEYRNGKAPEVRKCTSDTATFPASSNPIARNLSDPTDSDALAVGPAAPPTTPTTPRPPGVTPPTPSNCSSLVWVDGYTRADGTKVKGCFRRRPGCA